MNLGREAIKIFIGLQDTRFITPVGFKHLLPKTFMTSTSIYRKQLNSMYVP